MCTVQYSVGKYSAEEVADRNRASLRKILKYMFQLRLIAGQCGYDKLVLSG